MTFIWYQVFWTVILFNLKLHDWISVGHLIVYFKVLRNIDETVFSYEGKMWIIVTFNEILVKIIEKDSEVYYGTKRDY